jgi:hypothetical protein
VSSNYRQEHGRLRQAEAAHFLDRHTNVEEISSHLFLEKNSYGK